MEFKSEMDIHIAEKMLQFPLLGDKIEGVWNLKLSNEFHMTNDSHLFYTENAEGRLPLYEGKMIHQFKHQFAEARYWVDEKEGRKAVLGKKVEDVGQKLDYQGYRLGVRSIGRSTDIRTLIVGTIPKNAYCGNSILVLKRLSTNIYDAEIIVVQAILNSFIVDFYIRQMVSANLNMFYIYQLPVPRLTKKDSIFNQIVTRAAKLICTTPEFDDLAKEVGLESGVTNPDERAEIWAELDAMVAHLYGLTYEEFQHILGTFPIVKDEVKDRALEAFNKI
jgi:hypothetical protein